MKRWIIYLGRGGTVLAAIGFFLLMFSFGSSDPFYGFAGNYSISSKMVDTWPLPLNGTITPQQSLQVTVTANGTLIVYILEVGTQIVLDWIIENQLQPTTGNFFNVTNLGAFLEANPNSIGGYGGICNGTIAYKYIPTQVTNTTLFFSNPSSDCVRVDYEGSITSLVGLGSKVRNLAPWIISIGFILTLPWLAQVWIEKPSHPKL